MSALHTLLDTFHAAILDKDVTRALPSVKPNPRITPTQQLSIYIDGYRLRLIEAIRSDYPALLHYLGGDAFDALALRYIDNRVPTHFSLDRYPLHFADMVTTDAFAADLAQLEAAVARVFLCEETVPLTAESLTGVTTETLAAMTLMPRAASQLLTLSYAADTYLEELREGKTPLKPEASPRYLFLVRTRAEVKSHALTEPQYQILAQLCKGITVDAALDTCAQQHPELVPEFIAVLQHNFGVWIANGFFQSSEG